METAFETPPETITTLEAARAVLRGSSCRVLTDGKAGDLAPCLGIAERLGLVPDCRTVAPRAPFSWLMPWGPIDPRERAERPGSPIQPPFPDLALAAGRRAAAYLRAIRRASLGRTFTVFLRDPRSGTGTADLIWVPEHDRLRGPNVLASTTSPHRMSPEVLDAARILPPSWLPGDDRPLVALLLGGDSKDFRFTPADIDRLLDQLRLIAVAGFRTIATPSRRTPALLAGKVAAFIRASGGYFWDGSGENPLRSMLAHADFILTTAESTNMVGEAVATGTPVFVFRPSGGSRKIDRFLANLEALGAIRPFQGRLEGFNYEPMNSTPMIAIEIARRFAAHRHAGQEAAGASD